jgi:flagellar motor switch protein FliN
MALQPATDWLSSAQQTLASVALPPSAVELPRGAAPIQWPELGEVGTQTPCGNLNYAEDETLDLRMELGRAHLDPDEAAKLRKGAVVPLDKAAGALVELYAGDQLIGRGEALALDGQMAFRVVELFGHKDVRECR